MPLNDSLRFEDADRSVREAFTRTPEKIRLPLGTRLCKWTTPALVDAYRLSPWWSFVESTRLPSGALAEGFRVSEERAKRLGRSHRDFARVRAAVSEQFGNPMTHLLVISLNEAVWGFVGQAGGQREFKDERVDLRNVLLIGGAWQVWVPNLTRQHADLHDTVV
jgi:hypothetical protein